MADATHTKPSMNWDATDLLREWKRFQQHCTFTFDGPLSTKSEKQKVNYLMTYIGDKGREIYTTFDFVPAREGTPAENETLAGVYAKYFAYVAPKHDQIRATVNFNRRKQGAHEKFDHFVTDLKLLVKDCGFQEEERMLRDAIVLRSHHTTVQEKCLDEGDELTLAKAIRIGQNYETSHASLKVIEGADEDAKVNKVNEKGARRKTFSNKPGQGRSKKFSRKICGRCGYDSSHTTCPALGQECYNCHKQGHFGSVCRNSKPQDKTQEKPRNKKPRPKTHTHAVDQEQEWESDEEYAHLVSTVVAEDLISSVAEDNTDTWWATVAIGEQRIKMQIDTGAAQSLLPYKLYKKIKTDRPLQAPDRKFQSYTRHQIDVKGRVTLPTQYKSKTVNIQYYVVDMNQRPLLSGQASKALGLIDRINEVKEMADELDQYPELKTTTATLPGICKLKIDPTVQPVVHGFRRQPQALAEKIKEKLQEMEDKGQITKVTVPTDWVSSMVVVCKKGKIRICLDPKDLNKAIKREHYPLSTVEEVVASFPGTKVFSVLDAKSGFLQIKLDYESSLLTTFNTPQGRYRWLRLPFGIKSAPEIFQRQMDQMLEGIPGARAIMDDILVAGTDEKEHDYNLQAVIDKATEYNLGLNFEKCQIKRKRVNYVGHVITENGLEPGTDKVKAIRQMPAPEAKEDVRRFLGMVQYLSKFLPDLSTVDAPLRQILKKDNEFFWEKPQQASFDELKRMCSTAPVLAIFDPEKEVTIQCDASSYGLGGGLLQEGRPVAFTSRALTATEERYSQLEKETLAIVHSCTKFHYYVFGRPVTVESDHKPLQSIFKKPILAAPMRMQPYLLRLQPYDLTVTYKKGTELPIGDTLSRAVSRDEELIPEVPEVMVNTIDFIAVSPAKYRQFQECTANELHELHQMILKGWPDTRREVPHCVRDYWNVRDELGVADGIILKGMRLVVPPSLRQGMLAQIHETHMGIVKCKARARESLFWPGMSTQIDHLIDDCPECATYQNKQKKETLRPTKTPERPWAELGSDLFEFQGKHYVLTVDYYTRYIEVDELRDQSSKTTIEALKKQFCRHGLPDLLRTDNGPQFSSEEFASFCSDLGIEHRTSSPVYPQSNGEAERSIQTVKRLWCKSKDKQLALLDYRTTPMESCRLSPAQLLMGRRPKNKLPTAKELLNPVALNHSEIRRQLQQDKTRQKHYHDRQADDLPPLTTGDPVRMAPYPGAPKWLPATIVKHHDAPRSYIVECNGRKYRRNRRHLRLSTYRAQQQPRSIHDNCAPTTTLRQPLRDRSPTSPATNAKPAECLAATKPALLPPSSPTPCSPQRQRTTSQSSDQVKTRSGRPVKPPQRLNL